MVYTKLGVLPALFNKDAKERVKASEAALQSLSAKGLGLAQSYILSKHLYKKTHLRELLDFYISQSNPDALVLRGITAYNDNEYFVAYDLFTKAAAEGNEQAFELLVHLDDLITGKDVTYLTSAELISMMKIMMTDQRTYDRLIKTDFVNKFMVTPREFMGLVQGDLINSYEELCNIMTFFEESGLDQILVDGKPPICVTKTEKYLKRAVKEEVADNKKFAKADAEAKVEMEADAIDAAKILVKLSSRTIIKGDTVITFANLDSDRSINRQMVRIQSLKNLDKAAVTHLDSNSGTDAESYYETDSEYEVIDSPSKIDMTTNAASLHTGRGAGDDTERTTDTPDIFQESARRLELEKKSFRPVSAVTDVLGSDVDIDDVFGDDLDNVTLFYERREAVRTTDTPPLSTSLPIIIPDINVDEPDINELAGSGTTTHNTGTVTTRSTAPSDTTGLSLVPTSHKETVANPTSKLV